MSTTKPIQLAVQVTLTADAALLAALQHLVGSPVRAAPTAPPEPPALTAPAAPENYFGVFSPVPVQPIVPAVPRPPVPTVAPQASLQGAQVPTMAVPVATAPPPATQTIAAPTPVTVATPQPFSFDVLQTAAAQLAASGKQAAIAQLLAEFGIAALSHLPKEQYGAFATALRGKGAKI